MCENNMLFSRVKISCFRPKAHLVFHWCLYDKYTYILISSRATLNENLHGYIWAAYDGVLPRIPQVRPKSEIYTTEQDNEHPRPFNLRVPPVAIIVP